MKAVLESARLRDYSGEELVIDCKDQFCPMPIIKLSQGIKHIEVGQTLQLIATDPGSQHDVQAWARQTSHELINTKKDGKVFTFVVKRTH